MDFKEFPKIARLSRDCIITEKLDGTNAQIYITDESEFYVGSRSRWITPEADNYGFARWAQENKSALMELGPGQHFGEWWGNGIQRKYGAKQKHFSLFNVTRWGEGGTEKRPACCSVVPTLYKGPFTTEVVNEVLLHLSRYGSMAAPGFMQPEGVIIYHVSADFCFKKTLLGDEKPKGQQ